MGNEDESVQREALGYADLCYALGEYYEKRERNVQMACKFYTESLRCVDTYEPAMLSLAKIQMSEGNYEESEKQLVHLLRSDSRSAAALEGATLLAELFMILASNGARSEGGAQEYRDATFYYRHLLEKKPTAWHALWRLLYLLRRNGNVREFEKYLSTAESQCSVTRNAEQEPGFRFCRGMYSWHLSKPADALVDLNFARTRDQAEFGPDAALAMVNIYLFPDGSTGVSLESLQDTSSHSE